MSMQQATAFDYRRADVQATAVQPLAPDAFPYDDFALYEQDCRERCRAFWAAESGVLVCRRVRAGACFSAGCADAERSLALQLGALRAGMAFAGDMPGFLEPWYGIGTVASAFGVRYQWNAGQAPAVLPTFHSVAEALECPACPVAWTPIGRQTLEMIDYFIEATGGRLPMSLTDTQSPLNVATLLVAVSEFLMECIDAPDRVGELLRRIAELQVDFVSEQQARIGDALVWPGHGFSSSREFCGLGQSDDNLLTMSGAMYGELAAPSFSACGQSFGGVAFHSCGNWSSRLPVIRHLPGLCVVDAAFGPATDPHPNPPEPFGEALAGTGIVLNARVVGPPQTVLEYVGRLWRPGMKLIVVTYCETPAQQAEVYERIRDVCQ